VFTIAVTFSGFTARETPTNILAPPTPPARAVTCVTAMTLAAPYGEVPSVSLPRMSSVPGRSTLYDGVPA
jgi:hypothetical protein